MRVCVTGAAGFIGSCLAGRLTAAGHHVRVVDIAAPAEAYREPAWAGAAEALVTDLRLDGAADRAVAGCDVVYHLAANHGGVGYLHQHGPEAYLDNTRMSVAVLAAATRQQAAVFFASSACAYPIDRQHSGTAQVLTEPMLGTGEPDGLYGLEKLATLRLCEGLRTTGRLDARVAVFNTVFGPGQAVTGPRTKFPPAVVAKAIESARTGRPLQVWGDGSQVRQNIYIDDALDKVARVMAEPYDGPVNVTGVEAVRCGEVAELALQLVGSDAPIETGPGATGPMERVVSNAGWERAYGPDRQPPFAERFRQFVTWMEALA